jgi:hypothetical protein
MPATPVSSLSKGAFIAPLRLRQTDSLCASEVPGSGVSAAPIEGVKCCARTLRMVNREMCGDRRTGRRTEESLLIHRTGAE